jgi:hypothetical protein
MVITRVVCEVPGCDVDFSLELRGETHTSGCEVERLKRGRDGAGGCASKLVFWFSWGGE